MRCGRPCASQARLGLRGRHLGECHHGLASMAKLRVTVGLDELLSLVTFFAAAKKVTAAPHRGSANKPKRNRDPANQSLCCVASDKIRAHLRASPRSRIGRFHAPCLASCTSSTTCHTPLPPPGSCIRAPRRSAKI